MPRAQPAVLPKRFSQIDDEPEPWRVVYPLAEAVLLLTCATIASGDDFDDRRMGVSIIWIFRGGSRRFTSHPVRALAADAGQLR